MFTMDWSRRTFEIMKFGWENPGITEKKKIFLEIPLSRILGIASLSFDMFIKLPDDRGSILEEIYAYSNSNIPYVSIAAMGALIDTIFNLLKQIWIDS